MLRNDDWKKKHEEKAKAQYESDAQKLLDQLKPYSEAIQNNQIDELNALKKAFFSESSFVIKVNILKKYTELRAIYVKAFEAAQAAQIIISNEYYPPLSINKELEKLVNTFELIAGEKNEFNALTEFNNQAKQHLNFIENSNQFLEELKKLDAELTLFRTKEFYDNFNSSNDFIQNKVDHFITEINRLRFIFSNLPFFFDTSLLENQFAIAIQKLNSLPESLSNLTQSCDKEIILPANDAIWNVKNICEETILRIKGKSTAPKITLNNIQQDNKTDYFRKQPDDMIKLIFLEGAKKHAKIESLIDYILNFEKAMGKKEILVDRISVQTILGQFPKQEDLVKLVQACFEKKSYTLLKLVCLKLDNNVNKLMLGTHPPYEKEGKKEPCLEETKILNNSKYLKGILFYNFESFLSLAVKANWLNGVKFLLTQNADVNQINYRTIYNPYCWGYNRPNESEIQPESNSLCVAVSKRGSNPTNTKIIKLLIKAKPISNNNMNSTLHLACMNGKDFDVINMLVENNPKLVNLKNGSGETPLYFAGKYEVAKYLISRMNNQTLEKEKKAKIVLHNFNLIEKLEEFVKPGHDISVVDNFFSEYAPITTQKFFSSPIRQQKLTIVKSFLDYLKNHVNSSADHVVNYFIEKYKKENNTEENPFTILSQPIYSGLFSFFNIKEDPFDDLFTEYLNNSPNKNSALYKTENLLPFSKR